MVFLNNCVAEGGFGLGTILRRIMYHRKSRNKKYSLNLYHSLARSIQIIVPFSISLTKRADSFNLCLNPEIHQSDSFKHLLRVGWRNFFPVVLSCQFLVLVGNRFWFTYLCT
jgi:hypothetical protein